MKLHIIILNIIMLANISSFVKLSGMEIQKLVLSPSQVAIADYEVAFDLIDKKDYHRALPILERVARQNDNRDVRARALYLLAALYDGLNNFPKDPQKTLTYATEAANQNDNLHVKYMANKLLLKLMPKHFNF